MLSTCLTLLQATKRKHVVREVLEDFPEPSGDQIIVKVMPLLACYPCLMIVQLVEPRGNNLHECSWPDGSTALCSMPTKFRKNVWVRRGVARSRCLLVPVAYFCIFCSSAQTTFTDGAPGQFLIVDPIAEGDKVKAEIIAILYPDQVAHLKTTEHW